MNTNEEFLKLNKDPNYYRFDLNEIFNNDLIILGWKSTDTVYELACTAIAKYLDEKYDTKAVWGKGCAECDKGTCFENNDGYYLFYKVENDEQGKDIEEDLIDLLCSLYFYKENGLV